MGGAWMAKVSPEAVVKELLTDTRGALRPDGAVFFAIVTPRRSGTAYVPDAYARGVRHFVVEEAVDTTALPGADVIQVPSALHALQATAAARRLEFSGPVVGITGSNGKTVCKEWLYHLLHREDYSVLRSPRSYNSQTGVPLSVWNLRPGHRLAIFEAGLSVPGEMARLEQIIRPTTGLFTTLGEAHGEGFSSPEEKADEKMLLFRGADLLVYCRDHEAVHAAVVRAQAAGWLRAKPFSWTRSEAHGNAAVRVAAAEGTEAQTTITLVHGEETYIFTIPAADAASVENAVHCWCVCRALGADPGEVGRRMEGLHPVAMRLEARRAVGGSTLINDAYNADLTSLRIALDHLSRQKQHVHRTVILSDLLQSGRPEEELYAEVAALLHSHKVGRLMAVGPALLRMRAHFKRAGMRSTFYPNTEALVLALPRTSFENEAILVKGARVFGFEAVSQVLEDALHTTTLTIDLRALADNLGAFRRRLKPRVKTMAMVKAFSYGSGSYEIAHALEHAGADYLGVAYPDEGVALRRAGIRLPILVMSPDAAAFDRMIAASLEPEIFSHSSLESFLRGAEAAGVQDYPVHIKLDTGMHRLGFAPEDVAAMGARLRSAREVHVASVFSHLAAAEDASADGFTQHQAALFKRGVEDLSATLGYTPLRHLVNSSGAARHPELHFDMIRLGLGLYGIESSGAMAAGLWPISALRTVVAQVRTVPAGEPVGYGCGGAADRERRIATVCVGYADGYPRALGHSVGKMIIRGQRAPVVGSICMDLCMLDISSVAGAREGDEVTVFGPGLPIEELAEAAGTIPYEIMTGIGGRVKRVYVAEE